MAETPAIDAAEKARERMNAINQRAQRLMIRDLANRVAVLQGPVSLLAELFPESGSLSQVVQAMETVKIAKQIYDELNDFTEEADTAIMNGQSEAIDLGVKAARQTVEKALAPGIDLDLLERIGLPWQDIAPESLQALVGQLGDGSPLQVLLAKSGADTAITAREALLSGLLRGDSPREIARAFRDNMGMGLTRAMAISQTEIIRAHSEGARAQWKVNEGIVKGYRRVARKSSTTCMACIALDNKLYPLDTPMPRHVRCRCGQAPETITYRDLGIDVDEPEFDDETAQEWFESQEPEIQRKMMGPRAYEEYQDGTVALIHFVATSHDDDWGDSEHTATLGEMNIEAIRPKRAVRKADVILDMEQEWLDLVSAVTPNGQFVSARVAAEEWSSSKMTSDAIRDRTADMLLGAKPRKVDAEEWFERRVEPITQGGTPHGQSNIIDALTARVGFEINRGKKIPQQLWRGTQMDADDFRELIATGKTHHLLPSSFSRNEDEAVAYLGPKRAGEFRVMITGKNFKGWDIDKLSIFEDEQEVVTAGRFRIKAVNRVSQMPGAAFVSLKADYEIELEQIQ